MLELNKIYQGDCLEIMNKIDDNSLDLTITSPPYNVGINYDSIYDNHRKLYFDELHTMFVYNF